MCCRNAASCSRSSTETPAATASIRCAANFCDRFFALAIFGLGLSAHDALSAAYVRNRQRALRKELDF
jgi:hypothetical protein|tara:strand:- start:533 stop:736 length:204 start_codon:yes stop_codon:yes gene_type:complete